VTDPATGKGLEAVSIDVFTVVDDPSTRIRRLEDRTGAVARRTSE